MYLIKFKTSCVRNELCTIYFANQIQFYSSKLTVYGVIYDLYNII